LIPKRDRNPENFAYTLHKRGKKGQCKRESSGHGKAG